MQTVTIEKTRLREVLVANKATHEAEYAEAMDGYREEFDRQLALKRKQLKKGELPLAYFNDLPMPVDHTEDYDQVLAMLDYSVDENIELAHQEFGNYVLDDWAWKQKFNVTNSSYKKG